VPEQRRYQYSFDALARAIAHFTDALNLTKYSLYVFDYGAPTGFCLSDGVAESRDCDHLANRQRL
jgi:hypothetical protein